MYRFRNEGSLTLLTTRCHSTPLRPSLAVIFALRHGCLTFLETKSAPSFLWRIPTENSMKRCPLRCTTSTMPLYYRYRQRQWHSSWSRPSIPSTRKFRPASRRRDFSVTTTVSSDYWKASLTKIPKRILVRLRNLGGGFIGLSMKIIEKEMKETLNIFWTSFVVLMAVVYLWCVLHKTVWPYICQ